MEDDNIFAEEMKPRGYDFGQPSFNQKPMEYQSSDMKPMYKQIHGAYINLDGSDKGEVSQIDLEKYGIFVMHAIGQGQQVTKNDMNEMRQIQFYSLMPRGRVWALQRISSNFSGLNICNVIVLILATILCVLMYLNNKDACPSFAKAGIFYAVIGILWVLVSCVGIHAAHRRLQKNLTYFIAGVLVMLVLCIIASAYGLLNKDTDPSCNSDSSQTVIMISIVVFAILDVTFFAFMARKLRRMLLAHGVNNQQRHRPAHNRNAGGSPNRDNYSNPIGAQSNRDHIPVVRNTGQARNDNRDRQNRPQGQNSRGNYNGNRGTSSARANRERPPSRV